MTTHQIATAIMAAGWFNEYAPLNNLFNHRSIHCGHHRESIVVLAHKLMCAARKKNKPGLVEALLLLKKFAQGLDQAEFGVELIDFPMLLALGLDIRCKFESAQGCSID